MLPATAPNGLDGAAAEIEGRPDWADFARYCAARSRGLRTEAFSALDAFLGGARDWPFDARLAFAQWVIGHRAGSSLDGAFAPQPLVQQLLAPTVRLWCEREPDNAQAWFARAILRSDRPAEDMERALVLEPSHEEARRILVEWIVADIGYNQHEMPAFYIHDPRVDLLAIDRVVSLVADAGDAGWREALGREAAELRRTAEAWLAAHPNEGDFAER